MRPAMTIRHIITALATCVLAVSLVGCTMCSRSDSETGKAAQAERTKSKRSRKSLHPNSNRPQTRKVKVGEQTRRYIFVRSRVTSAKKPAPVLVMLHDNHGSVRDVTGRRDLMGGASKLGYLVAAPIAAKEGWGPGLCGGGTAAAAKQPAAAGSATKAKAATAAAKATKAAKTASAKTDAAAEQKAPAPGSDVDYIKAVLADLGGIGADPKRIYLVATGSAAAFAERLVTELPGQFAGVALFAPEDCNQAQPAAPSSPVPTLVVTGQKPAVTDKGAGASPAPAEKSASISALDYWIKANACDAKPQPQPSTSIVGVNVQRYTCKMGTIEQVSLTTSAKPVPRKMGKKYTMRYMAEFFEGKPH
jgi:poly(3-hydroxybutyrate) depolymerase